MDFQEFSVFANDARLWVYPFREPLAPPASLLVGQTLNGFLPGWASHGERVEGRYLIYEDRFCLLAGHSPGGISGCSIDSSVENFKLLRDRHGLDGLDRSLVFFRDPDGRIQADHFFDFQKRVGSGGIMAETRVFDTALTTIGELREGGLEKPFQDSWHAQRFS